MADEYDAGLLNDYGGGNVEWWHDYLRAEIGRANAFHTDITNDLTARLSASEAARVAAEKSALEAINRMVDSSRKVGELEALIWANGKPSLIEGWMDRAEKAEATLAEARKALEPFAAVADEYDDREDDNFEVWKDAGPVRSIRATFELRKYRAARAALTTAAGDGA